MSTRENIRLIARAPLTNESCRASQNCGGQVKFDFRLPTGQIEFSGIFLTLLVEQSPQPPSS